MRSMLYVLGAVLAVSLSGSTAQAQVKNVPIDTNNLIVKPVDTTTNILGTTAKYLSRVTANAISGDGFVKTINNLFGRTKDQPRTLQNGLSPLPQPSMYPSNNYQSPLRPEYPRNQSFNR